MTVLVVGCSNAQNLARDIAGELGRGARLIETGTQEFEDGEHKVFLNIRGNAGALIKNSIVVIIQRGQPNPKESIEEVEHVANIANGYGARRIIAVFTYMPYMRQDKWFFEMESGTTRIEPRTLDIKMRNLRANDVDTVILFDVHFSTKFGRLSWAYLKKELNFGVRELNFGMRSIQKWPEVINVPVGKLLVDFILKEKGLKPSDVVLMAPDKGAAPRVEDIVRQFNGKIKWTVFDKTRFSTTQTSMKKREGDTTELAGKTVIIVDDMICSGGTMKAARKVLKDFGARQVFAAAAHGIFGSRGTRIFDATIIRNMKEQMDYCVVSDSLEPEGIDKVPMGSLIVDALKGIL